MLGEEGENAPQTLAKYRLLLQLGRGGMGEGSTSRSSAAPGGFTKLKVVKCLLPDLAADPGIPS